MEALSYESLWIAMKDRERLKDGSMKDAAKSPNVQVARQHW